MGDTSTMIDFDNHEQVRLLTNLREEIRILLGAHDKGIWFRMLPNVFYMHFNRDIHLDRFAINNSFLFLDYIADIIKFDLPDNGNEDDFIIELNNELPSTSERPMDLKMKRDVLFQMLQNASLDQRGAILREICIIDEYFKQYKDESPSMNIPTHEQVAVRLQKMRSMIDFCLRYLVKTSSEISDNDLIQLYDQSDEFICKITSLTQRLSSSTN